MTVWTIGHSTRALGEFLDLLAGHAIQTLADVRRFPGSRRHPQFAQDALSQVLDAHGIAYRWLPALGGRRRPRTDSRNTAWRNASFRGYADHMESAAFAAGLDELLALAGQGRITLMCAEAPWWRCHRALIADVLRVRGIEVVHIVDARSSMRHPYTSAARIIEGRLTYAPPAERGAGAGVLSVWNGCG